MNDWKNSPIKHRWDGSYVIAYAGFPEYHVPNNDEFASLWAEVDAYARTHPEQITDEPAPPTPTDAELLERAKALKAAEFDRAMADIDAALMRSTSDLVVAMLTPATLAADDDGASTLSDDELERSKLIFVTLRQVQAQNRALREQARTAKTVEEARAIDPIIPDMAALAAAF